MLDTGGELSGLGGMSKRTSLTREVASQLVARLENGASIAVMQSGNTAEMLQPWTTDKVAVLRDAEEQIDFNEAVADLRGDRERGRAIERSAGGKSSRRDDH